MAGSGNNTLRAVLKELGWSYTRPAAELRRHATVALPRTESMVTLISRWVNNHRQADDCYRDLHSRATGRARAELLSDELVALTTLPSGLVVARSGEGLPASGKVLLSSGGDGLIAWLRQQEPELKGLCRPANRLATGFWAALVLGRRDLVRCPGGLRGSDWRRYPWTSRLARNAGRGVMGARGRAATPLPPPVGSLPSRLTRKAAESPQLDARRPWDVSPRPPAIPIQGPARHLLGAF